MFFDDRLKDSNFVAWYGMPWGGANNGFRGGSPLKIVHQTVVIVRIRVVRE